MFVCVNEAWRLATTRLKQTNRLHSAQIHCLQPVSPSRHVIHKQNSSRVFVCVYCGESVSAFRCVCLDGFRTLSSKRKYQAGKHVSWVNITTPPCATCQFCPQTRRKMHVRRYRGSRSIAYTYTFLPKRITRKNTSLKKF